jgi:hypothetical protein
VNRAEERLTALAGEEAQQLNNNAFQRVCRRPSLARVENSGAYVAVENVGMHDVAPDGDSWHARRAVVLKADL